MRLVCVFALLLLLSDYSLCGEVNILNAVNIKWQNQGTQTQFWATASLPSINPNNAWFGVGINTNNQMEYLNAVICQSNGTNSWVRHFAAVGRSPVIFDANQPQVGLSNTQIAVVGSNITCSFQRANSQPSTLTVPNDTTYLGIGSNSTYYVLSAFGSGGFNYHGPNKDISNTMQSFATAANQTSTSAMQANSIKNLIQMMWEFIQAIFAMFLNNNNNNQNA